MGAAFGANNFNSAPFASGTRFAASRILSSKLGQLQCDSNFDSEVYSGVAHRSRNRPACG